MLENSSKYFSMYRNKKTGIIGVIITIFILVIIVIISNIKIENISQIEGALSSLVMPIQNGMTYIKNKISGNNNFFLDMASLKEENKTLKAKNSDLEKALREFEIIKSENETLKEYVNLKEKYTEYTTVPGYVINKSTNNYSNVIVINIGSKDGVSNGMPVISDKGLVGHILSTTENESKVETLIDTSSAVSSVVGTERNSVIVRGTLENNKMLKGTYISTEATLLEGDKVETSGLGGLYPKGITIGTVKKVVNTKNMTNRYIEVEPAVNFEKLETVLVINK